MQFGEDTAMGNQRVMRTLLHYHSVLEHDDLVGIDEGAQTMRDHDDGASLHQASQRLDHQMLRFRVQSSGWFVQNQNRAVANHRPRDRDALALATRERLTTLANH